MWFKPVGEVKRLEFLLTCRLVLCWAVDCAGPAESLFKESYYQLMKTALRDGGILCCQGDVLLDVQSLIHFIFISFFIYLKDGAH